MLSSDGITRCGTCGARIRWTTTEDRHLMPVDADPHPDGNQAVYADRTGRLKSRGISKERPLLEHAEARMMPHFATCKRPPQPRLTIKRTEPAGNTPPDRWPPRRWRTP
ncbi:hypothetical protein ACWEFL_15880 [Streptomyces sp. NPDC004838]